MSEKEIAVNAGKMKWLEEFDIKIKENAFVTPSSHLNYKELVKFIDEHIRQALQSQMSDLIDSMPTKMNCPCGKFNCHGKGYDDALDEILLLMKKQLIK